MSIRIHPAEKTERYIELLLTVLAAGGLQDMMNPKTEREDGHAV